jgi:hypothetical protein
MEISGFWQGQEVWSSGTYEQSLMWLGYRKPDTPTKVSEKARSKLVIIAVNEN